jgi:hypothetical protein
MSAYHASTRCPICQCVVIVPKREGIAARLLRALSLASHVRALHQAKVGLR